MAECIEREALITKFKKMGLGEHGLVERLFADGVYAVIAAFPAADVAPVVHGRWMKRRNGGTLCSRCGHYTQYKGQVLDMSEAIACPWCGAMMDGETE